MPLLLAGLLISTRVGGPPRHGGEFAPFFFGLIGTLLTAVFLAAVAWMLFGEEEWRLRPGNLEIRKRIFGREWTKEYADAELRFRQVYHRGRTGHNRTWQLILNQYGRSHILSESTWMGMAEAQALGAYVAAVTGWNFHTSPGDPTTDGFTMFGA